MASRHTIFGLLFFPGLDHKWSRDTKQWCVLRNKKIKLTDFSEAAKFWNGLVNFHKVMNIIRFYANYSLRRHAYAHKDFFAFSYFPRTIADWSASEAILSSALLETFKSNFSAFLKVIHWFCTAHLLLRITRWPPLKRAFEVTPLKWSRLKRNAIGIFACGCFSCRGETHCAGNLHNVSSTRVAEFDFLTENLDSGLLNLCLLTLIFI